jgi:hypothetical protein
MARSKRSIVKNNKGKSSPTRPDVAPGTNLLVKEDGTVSFPMVIMVAGVLLLSSGRWFWGMLILGTGFTMAVCSAAMDQIPEEDKQDIRYNIMEAEDVVRELISWEAELYRNQQPEVLQKGRIHLISGLEALAKKYAQQQHLKALKARKELDSQDPSFGKIMKEHRLELICQQAAYIAYRLFPVKDDQVVAAALSLHALVAKDPQVRQRHLFEADNFGLDKPVHCMREALKTAKAETNEDKEQQSAELQRKACLLLGALADGDADVATKIVEEDGLEAVLEAVNWYRYHEDVGNWALWAVFILSYENPPNKVRNVELGGVPIIIGTMQNVTECLEVARHGIAVLFDLMRDENTPGGANQSSQTHKHLDVWQIRRSALAAGLHEAVLTAMETFSDKIDIVMMGAELLAGTDYRGPVPQYQPKTEDLAE